MQARLRRFVYYSSLWWSALLDAAGPLPVRQQVRAGGRRSGGCAAWPGARPCRPRRGTGGAGRPGSSARRGGSRRWGRPARSRWRGSDRGRRAHRRRARRARTGRPVGARVAPGQEAVQPVVPGVARRQAAIEDGVARARRRRTTWSGRPIPRACRGAPAGVASATSASRSVIRLPFGVEGPAAEAVAVEADRRQGGGALPAQALGRPALHDGEEQAASRRVPGVRTARRAACRTPAGSGAPSARCARRRGPAPPRSPRRWCSRRGT